MYVPRYLMILTPYHWDAVTAVVPHMDFGGAVAPSSLTVAGRLVSRLTRECQAFRPWENLLRNHANLIASDAGGYISCSQPS
jgi:hypothetical protein